MKNHWLQQRSKKQPVSFTFELIDHKLGHTVLDVPCSIGKQVVSQTINIESTDGNFTSYVNNNLAALVYATPPKMNCDAILRVFEKGKQVEEWGLMDLILQSYSHRYEGGKIISGMVFTSQVIGTVKSGYFTIS